MVIQQSKNNRNFLIKNLSKISPVKKNYTEIKYIAFNSDLVYNLDYS